MKLSRPKAYINILLDEIVKITRDTYTQASHKRISNSCSISDIHEYVDARMLEVNKLQQEILELLRD